MNDLLERIRAAPDDDQLRSVYADGLLEQDDPLGEFILLQLKRSREGATTAELQRERALLKKNWTKWTGALAPAIHWNEDAFERGFLASITIPRVSTSKAVLKALVGEPMWATARTVRNVRAHEFWLPILSHPVMKGLRSTSVDEDELLRLEGVQWRLDDLTLNSPNFVEAHLGALAWTPFSSLRRLELKTRSVNQLEVAVRTLARLERFEAILSEPDEPRALVQFLSRNLCREVVLGTRGLSAAVKAKTINLKIDNSRREVDAISAARVAQEAIDAGLKPGSVRWVWSMMAVDKTTFSQLGFEVGA